MRYVLGLLSALALMFVSAFVSAQSPLQLEIKQSHVRFALGAAQAPRLVSGLSAVPVGGLSVADNTSRWRYGAAVGRIDKNKNTADLHYGSEAASAWMSTQLTSALALEGLYQQAEGYEQLGIGGRYDLNPSIDIAVNLTATKHGMDMHWDLGRWGVLGANYLGTQPQLGEKNHSFGLNQQFWYSPNLRIDVDAQRQTQSGDYTMGLRLYVPVF